MGKKAVYSNKGLQVYISGEDFEALLDHQTLWVKLHIGKVETAKCFVWVEITAEAYASIANAYKLESRAIDKARTDYSKLRSLNPSNLRK